MSRTLIGFRKLVNRSWMMLPKLCPPFRGQTPTSQTRGNSTNRLVIRGTFKAYLISRSLQLPLHFSCACKHKKPSNTAQVNPPLFTQAFFSCSFPYRLQVLLSIDSHCDRNQTLRLSLLPSHEAQSGIGKSEEIATSSHSEHLLPLPAGRLVSNISGREAENTTFQ